MNQVTSEVTTTERGEKVSGLTGQTAKAVNIDVSRMLNEGLLIDIDLHGFSMLRVGVDWKELGISPEDRRRARITKGKKMIADPKYVRKLKSLEVRLRQSLDRYSYDLTGFRPWRWLPFSAYDTWKEEWNQLLDDLHDFKMELVAALPEIKKENETYFKRVARKAWQSYNTKDDDAVIKTPEGDFFVGYEDFESSIVEGALGKVPTKELILYGIQADYRTGYLIAPPEVSKMRAEAERAEAEAQAQWLENEERVAKIKAEEAEAQMKMNELERREMAERAAVRDRIDEIRKEELEKARREIQEGLSPMREAMLKFRSQMYEDVVSIAESLEKNGTLVGRVSGKAKSLKETYELLAGFTGDDDLEAALEQLDHALGTPSTDGGAYNVGALNSALNKLMDVTSDASDELRRSVTHKSVAGYLEF
jgi:hypothetical protein